MAAPVTFGIVGSGWRAEFFARLAALLPERLTLVGAAVRRPESAEELTRRWGVPTHLSPAELASRQRPEFVVSSVPWPVNPEVIGTLAGSGVRVLDPLTRDGWTGAEEPQDATTTLATLDLGDGRSGLYDFTDNQWHNRLRQRRSADPGCHALRHGRLRGRTAAVGRDPDVSAALRVAASVVPARGGQRLLALRADG